MIIANAHLGAPIEGKALDGFFVRIEAAGRAGIGRLRPVRIVGRAEGDLLALRGRGRPAVRIDGLGLLER